MYEYQAQVDEVIDGDTVDVTVDLGFNMRRDIRLRIHGVDTAETYGVDHDSEEFQRGKKHTKFVEEWFSDAQQEYDGKWPIVVEIEKRGKFGRYLATVSRKNDGAEVGEALLSQFDDVDY